jgi:hypothetical protein
MCGLTKEYYQIAAEKAATNYIVAIKRQYINSLLKIGFLGSDIHANCKPHMGLPHSSEFDEFEKSLNRQLDDDSIFVTQKDISWGHDPVWDQNRCLEIKIPEGTSERQFATFLEAFKLARAYVRKEEKKLDAPPTPPAL